MLELALDARRGGFHLQVECRLASEWTVIFGPSGAGKSTLLRLLAGLDRPDHGQIVLDGQTLTDAAQGIYRKPGHRHTALVAQQPALFPHLNVTANVAYGLAHLDRSGRGAHVEEMLELVDAMNLGDRRPRELSGGEAQRVALARALAPLPRLLLLDEPFLRLMGLPAMLCFRDCRRGSPNTKCRRCWSRMTPRTPMPPAPRWHCCAKDDWQR